MKRILKSITFINLIILLVVIFSDYITKQLANHYIQEPFQFLFFQFNIKENPGIIFSSFTDINPLIRVVFLSTFGSFLIFVYICIQYLLSIEASKLRIGLSFTLGGILGNVFERIQKGTIIDFIQIKMSGFSTAIFNLADFWQWVGYLFIIVFLIKDREKIWPKSNQRSSYWNHPYFQMRYCFILMTVGLAFSIISGVFFYTFLKSFLLVDPIFEKNLLVFFISYSMITFIFIISLFIIGQFLSHRIAGPIHSFESYLEDLLKGKNRYFQLRKKDEFQNLKKLADKIKTAFEKNSSENSQKKPKKN